MSQHLPALSGRQVVAAFKRDGWAFRRQTASHMILAKTGEVVSLSVRIIARSPAARCEA